MPGSDVGASSRGEKLRSSTRPAQRRPANCLAQMVPSNYWQGDSHEATRNIVLCRTRRELQRSARSACNGFKPALEDENIHKADWGFIGWPDVVGFATLD